MIIADFQREYAIDLYVEAWVLSEEKFHILLSGLSAESRFMMRMNEKYPSKNRRRDDNQRIPSNVSTDSDGIPIITKDTNFRSIFSK